MSSNNESHQQIESLKNIQEQSISSKATLTKVNSTLSKLLSQEQNKEQDPKINSNSNDIWNGKSLTNNPLSITYNIYWQNSQEQGKQYEIRIKLPGNLKVEECILLSVKEFNKLLKAYQLPQDLTQYELHFAKKSGLPKDDYPALDPEQILSQTKVLSLCLIFINKMQNQKQQQLKQQLPNTSKEITYEKSLNDFKRTTSASSQDEMIPQSSGCLCFQFKRTKKTVVKQK